MGRSKQLAKGEVLDAINRWIAENGVPPTVQELRRKLGLGSKRTVLRYLHWLEDEGDIERWPGARGIRPLRGSSTGDEMVSVPLVGEVPAGPLMLAEENLEGFIQFPFTFISRSAQYFLLRVRGDSMNRAQVAENCIESRDLVLVKQQPTAEPGEIIVALIDGQATIKRLGRGPDYYFLKPESTNRSHQPIVLDEDFQIQGIVTRVIKQGAELLCESDS